MRAGDIVFRAGFQGEFLVLHAMNNGAGLVWLARMGDTKGVELLHSRDLVVSDPASDEGHESTLRAGAALLSSEGLFGPLRDAIEKTLHALLESRDEFVRITPETTTRFVPSKPLSLTRETVLNLTPRAARPPPTLAPPIDVAVEKEGKR